jgi:hypothetical protein
MSSNYDGNPSGVQSPASAPVAGSPPRLVLPADADAANAASIAQALKVVADYEAFLQNPFANASAWTQKIWGVKDAQGRQRWYLDHFGMPRESRLAWNEDFTPAPGFNATGTGTLTVGRQSIVTVGAGALTGSTQPAAAYSNPPHPASLVGTSAGNASRQFVGVLDGGAAGNRTELRLNDNYATATFANDTLISCVWDFAPFTNSAVNWVVGFAGSGEFVNTVAHGAFFIRPNTAGTNWLCRTINGGSPTEVDSGVLASTAMRTMRIDLVGGSFSDDGTARALFWIDGTLVANITATLAINAGNLVLPLAGGVVQSAIANPVFLMNGIRYAQLTRVSTP